jgi:hypothetical protein
MFTRTTQGGERCPSQGLRSDGIAPEVHAPLDERRCQAAAAVGTSDRPALASTVQLMGELQGSGFEHRQWLIQCEGRFIQVSELLYRVVEQVNGERTFEEIASAATDSSDWLVSGDDVRHLVQTRLLPLGLVATGSARVAPRDDGRRSPLQVSMRKRILGPTVVAPMTRVLQVLYMPPVLVPMLIAIVIAHGWLYLVHGLTESLDSILFKPGVLLAALPIFLASSVFHELGHATGLRYGGGHVRGIGFGFYLLYPAFYTDVTDAYRLSRWARLRTDLGGFYFHLIFALLMIGLYAMTGQEIFLTVVMLISLDIAFQWLPHVRLDGYWVLADLTGIPDFLSQAGPFVRSLLPLPSAGSDKLPRLKRWVKITFLIYLILAIPMLVLLLLFIVFFLPSRMATGWDSLLGHVRSFSAAQGAGDPLAMASAVAEMLILLLVMVGLAYIVGSLVRGWIRGVWNWSKPTPARRFAGALTVAASLAVLGWAWVPQLPYTVWAWTVPAGPPGTEAFDVHERAHVGPPVFYEQTPPVGGNHMPIWQNCGFYDAPILNETAVHSLEHGAVWITYRPDLPAEQVGLLRQVARGQPSVLASPRPDLPAPVVATAWGRQLRLDSAADPRLAEFVRAFRDGRQAPEPGGPCTGGIGEPG